MRLKILCHITQSFPLSSFTGIYFHTVLSFKFALAVMFNYVFICSFFSVTFIFLLFHFCHFFIYFSVFTLLVPLLLLFVHFLTSCSHQGLVARSNLYSRHINSRDLGQLLVEQQNPLKLPGNAPFEPQSTIYHGAPLSVTMVLRKPH